MATRHRIRLVLFGAMVLAVVAFAVHSAASPTAAGQTFSWAASTTPAGSPAAPPTGVARAIPTAAAASSPEVGPFAGLTAPLSSVLRSLNAETSASARGQYSILQEIGNAIRDHIEQFLNWVVGGRR